MSTGRKWFLALALLSTFSFFMFMFPTKVDSAVQGDDVWLVEGYDGSILVHTGVPAVDQHWAGALTLTARTEDGTTVASAEAHAEQDWDETIAVDRKIGGSPKTLRVSVDLKVPADVREGTDLVGTVTGEVVTPQYYKGGYVNATTTVDKTVTIHVADQGEVADHSDETSRWPLPDWTLWVLWAPMLLFVLTTERVSTRIARRVNA